EEVFYFDAFRNLGLDKAVFNKERVTANRSGTLISEREEMILKKISSSKLCIFKPREKELMLGRIREAVRKKKPMKFFMLWGVWRKERADAADAEAVEIIEKMIGGVRGLHPPGAEIAILLTDTHAELNLIDMRSIYGYNSYLGSFERYAKERGIRTLRLSEVLKTVKEINDEEIVKIEKHEIWPRLLASAKKYYGGEDSKLGAKKYVARRLSEKPMLEKIFSDSIFISYSGPRYEILAPKLPTLYLMPNRRRTSKKPWFTIGG
ncbi:MAG: hypothetical protein ABIF01_04455, partial [Candidatus Micrarchaeota archaeon]